MNRRIRFVLSVLLSVATAVPTVATQSRATNEEYAVYSALINQKFITDKVRLVVISNKTIDDTADKEHFVENSRQLVPQLSPMQATLEDYKEKNKSSHRLEKEFDLAVPYVLFTEAESKEIFKEGWDGWERFYERFPHSSGEVAFSSVGFNVEKDQAIVYVVKGCGWLCASGQYVLPVKTDGKWKIARELLAWIS